MKIGLDKIGLNDTESCEAAYLALMEEPDQLSDSCEDLAYEKVYGIARAIANSNHPEAVVDFLMQDENFAQAFGSGDVRENIKRYLEVSDEHMGQDFLRWSWLGLIAGAILSSFGRIRKVCEKAIRVGIDGNKMDRWTARSIYLPPAEKMTKILKGLEIMGNAIITFKKDPKSRVEPVVNALHTCGIDVHYNGKVEKVITMDWKAVGGSLAGAIIGNFLLLGIGGIAGNVIGGHMASDNGETLYDKGYTPQSMLACAKQILKLMDQVMVLKNAKAAGVPTNAKDMAIKQRFIRKAIKVYIHTIRNVGRGLATGLKHVMN